MPIEDVVARLWPGRAARIARLTAGLTNQNFRVEVDGTPPVVQVDPPAAEALDHQEVIEVPEGDLG
jgi:hypothetical protein